MGQFDAFHLTTGYLNPNCDIYTFPRATSDYTAAKGICNDTASGPVTSPTGGSIPLTVNPSAGASQRRSAVEAVVFNWRVAYLTTLVLSGNDSLSFSVTALRRETHLQHEVSKPRVGAQGIIVSFNFEVLHLGVVRVVGSVEECECFFFVSKSDIENG